MVTTHPSLEPWSGSGALHDTARLEGRVFLLRDPIFIMSTELGAMTTFVMIPLRDIITLLMNLITTITHPTDSLVTVWIGNLRMTMVRPFPAATIVASETILTRARMDGMVLTLLLLVSAAVLKTVRGCLLWRATATLIIMDRTVELVKFPNVISISTTPISPLAMRVLCTVATTVRMIIPTPKTLVVPT